MLARLAHVFLRFLSVLSVLALAGSVALHLGVLNNIMSPDDHILIVDFFATWTIGLFTTSLIEDRWKWISELKICPTWMWQTSMFLFGYIFFIFIASWIFPTRNWLNLVFSAMLMFFNATNFCYLYKAEWMRLTSEKRVIKGLRNSFIFLAAAGLIFVVFPHRQPSGH